MLTRVAEYIRYSRQSTRSSRFGKDVDSARANLDAPSPRSRASSPRRRRRQPSEQIGSSAILLAAATDADAFAAPTAAFDEASETSAPSVDASRNCVPFLRPITAFASRSRGTSCEWSLSLRAQEEKEFIKLNDTARADTWYLVDVHWLGQWKRFCGKGGPPPGPIDNHRLLSDDGTPLPDLQPVVDYRGVNAAIWNFWFQRYGGGPEIRRRQLDIYARDSSRDDEESTLAQETPPPTPAVHLPFASPKSPTRLVELPPRTEATLESPLLVATPTPRARRGESMGRTKDQKLTTTTQAAPASKYASMPSPAVSSTASTATGSTGSCCPEAPSVDWSVASASVHSMSVRSRSSTSGQKGGVSKCGSGVTPTDTSMVAVSSSLGKFSPTKASGVASTIFGSALERYSFSSFLGSGQFCGEAAEESRDLVSTSVENDSADGRSMQPRSCSVPCLRPSRAKTRESSRHKAIIDVRCDKCDGPHGSEKCPHFRKVREKHADAWRGMGRRTTKDTAVLPPILSQGTVFRQPADGSCLFHALAFGLADDSTAASLRQDICDYVARNPNMAIADTALKEWIRFDSGGSVLTYADSMRGDSWGGGIEIAACSRMKQVNVHVYEKCHDDGEGYRRISAFEVNGTKKTVSLLYQGRMHYDAIVV